MSESFVDLSYRGLALGKRIKLTQVRPSTGLPRDADADAGRHARSAIATDDGVALEAIVAEIHEQIGGASSTPGMLVQPGSTAQAQRGVVEGARRVPEPRTAATAPRSHAAASIRCSRAAHDPQDRPAAIVGEAGRPRRGSRCRGRR